MIAIPAKQMRRKPAPRSSSGQSSLSGVLEQILAVFKKKEPETPRRAARQVESPIPPP